MLLVRAGGWQGEACVPQLPNAKQGRGIRCCRCVHEALEGIQDAAGEATILVEIWRRITSYIKGYFFPHGESGCYARVQPGFASFFEFRDTLVDVRQMCVPNRSLTGGSGGAYVLFITT